MDFMLSYQLCLYILKANMCMSCNVKLSFGSCLLFSRGHLDSKLEQKKKKHARLQTNGCAQMQNVCGVLCKSPADLRPVGVCGGVDNSGH